MTLGDQLAKSQAEDDARYARNAAKLGSYTGDSCPNCGRVRVMLGADQKRRCEKCCWCIEDGNYDFEFLDFSH